MRKYFPALSKEFSLPSSHRSFRGSLKPCGGGPAGVARRNADEEKAALIEGHNRRAGEGAPKADGEGRSLASVASDLTGAIKGKIPTDNELGRWRVGLLMKTKVG